MSGIIEGYNYDIFISYRQKDNKGDHWVSEFVEALKTELESTFKEEICVYFDINPHDGLLETHDVDASLKEKLKCLIFIPIISRTYCDPKSFAWEHEFKAFVEMASADQFGLKVKLPNGNVANRVLPVRIHELDQEDINECDSVLGSFIRGIEFIYKEPGVNRPLKSDDDEKVNLNHTKYRNQINKTANAVKDIITGFKAKSGDSVSRKPVQEIEVKIQENRIIGKFWKLRKITITLLILLTAVASVFVYNVISDDNKLKKLQRTGSLCVVVLPFQNLTDDSQYNIQEKTIQNNLISILSSEPGDFKVVETMVSGRDNKTEQLNSSVLRKISNKSDADLIIYGSISKSNGTRVIANVYDVEKEQIVKPFIVDYKQNITDSMYHQIRNFLLVSKFEKQIPPDFRDFKRSNSPEAYSCYMKGYKANFDHDYQTAVYQLRQAVEKDSTFTAAAFRLALCLYNLADPERTDNADVYAEAKKWALKAYQDRENLPEIGKAWVDYTYTLCNDQPLPAIKYGRKMLEVNDQLPFGHYIQAKQYDRLNMHENAMEEYEKSLQIYLKSDTRPIWVFNYTDLGKMYHQLKMYKKERRLYNRAQKDFPDDDVLLFRQAVLALSANETIAAERFLEQFDLVLRRKSFTEGTISKLFGDIYSEAGLPDEAEEYYRKSYDEDERSFKSKNTLAYFLIDSDRKIDEGMRLIEECLVKNPEHYEYLHTKGWGLYKVGNYNEALKLLQKSWNLRMEKATYEHSAKLHLDSAANRVALRTHDSEF